LAADVEEVWSINTRPTSARPSHFNRFILFSLSTMLVVELQALPEKPTTIHAKLDARFTSNRYAAKGQDTVANDTKVEGIGFPGKGGSKNVSSSIAAVVVNNFNSLPWIMVHLYIYKMLWGAPGIGSGNNSLNKQMLRILYIWLVKVQLTESIARGFSKAGF
jgi:hypothetical protein